MPSVQTKNPLLRQLIKTRPFGPECLDVWNEAAKQSAFPQQLADAFASAGEDINIVLELTSHALQSEVTDRIDEALPVIDKVVAVLDVSFNATLEDSHVWVDFLHAYAGRAGMESDNGKLAIIKLEKIVRKEVFGRNKDFATVANGLAMRANRTQPLDYAMADIWKRLILTAHDHYCVDSSGRSVGAKYLKDSSSFPMRRRMILDRVEHYSADESAVGVAARMVLEMYGDSAPLAPQVTKAVTAPNRDPA